MSPFIDLTDIPILGDLEIGHKDTAVSNRVTVIDVQIEYVLSLEGSLEQLEATTKRFCESLVLYADKSSAVFKLFAEVCDSTGTDAYVDILVASFSSCSEEIANEGENFSKTVTGISERATEILKRCKTTIKRFRQAQVDLGKYTSKLQKLEVEGDTGGKRVEIERRVQVTATELHSLEDMLRKELRLFIELFRDAVQNLTLIIYFFSIRLQYSLYAMTSALQNVAQSHRINLESPYIVEQFRMQHADSETYANAMLG